MYSSSRNISFSEQLFLQDYMDFVTEPNYRKITNCNMGHEKKKLITNEKRRGNCLETSCSNGFLHKRNQFVILKEKT